MSRKKDLSIYAHNDWENTHDILRRARNDSKSKLTHFLN